MKLAVDLYYTLREHGTGCRQKMELGFILLLEMFCVAFPVLLNTTGCIDQFLLSCKERMTGRADLDFDFLFNGTDFNFIPACTNNL